MQVPHILPATCPDTIEDVAEGSTFYLDPDAYPEHEGQGFMRLRSRTVHAKTEIKCARLKDGRIVGLGYAWPCRVVALVAEVTGDEW